MIRRKKEIKRTFLALLFVLTIILSNVQILNNFNLFQDNTIKNTYDEGVTNEFPLSSDLRLNDNIIGSGLDQDVRIYVNNKSENKNNNQEYFEIPSLPSDDMFLTYGDFNFSFQNNYTTEYIIEDDDALDALDFISFDFNSNENFSNITYNPGTLLGGSYGEMVDDNPNTNIQLNATNGVLNFTITANFSETKYPLFNLDFNRSHILGLFLTLNFELNEDANLTIKIKDFATSTWEEVTNKFLINSSLGPQEIQQKYINENLNYIDFNNNCLIQFVFERSDTLEYNIMLREFDFQSTYAFDLPITNQNYVALEFDLLGLNTTVNGFYAWIRTLDLAKAATTQLNITLYRANRTVVRTDENLRNIYLGPDYNELIDSDLVDYAGDSLSYFEFDIANAKNLNLSNYFIVIKSNNSDEVFSLVTLPWFAYGDDLRTEHQLKTTEDDGTNWVNAHKKIDSVYTSGQLDASSFKLNVTRGYKPSDFKINNNLTLRIQDLPLEDLLIPNNESSYLEWGIGRWNHNFTTPIEDNPNFRIDLTWNKTYIKGFKFNITSYSVNAYWVETSTASYRVSYDENPEWAFVYNLDRTDVRFNDWNFIEFWYIYPNFMNAHNLTNPDIIEIFYKTDGESILKDNPNMFKVVVHKNISNPDGLFTLNLTSFNFIHKMHSYINYKGNLLETNGFMYGDNISVGVEIQDYNFKAPISGNANATLFYPNGTQFLGAKLNSSNGFIDDSILFFDFGNQTVLNLTKTLTIFGVYHIGFFWFNGSAIGCKKLTIYIDTYDVALYDCEYDPLKKKNVLNGEVKNQVFYNYTILLASVNETTGIYRPSFFPINNTDVNVQFSRRIEGEKLSLLLTSFKQSQNIINPNETINIKTSIQNLHSFLPIDVKVNVKLVSYINEDWIIAENTSNTILLNYSGHPNEMNEFAVDLTIPDLDAGTNTWFGVNAPIRLGGAKTIITIYINDLVAGVYESSDYSLLSNKTKNNYEGHILGVRVAEEIKGTTIIYDFNRDECIYYPENTTFLVNIIDRNYVSSYKQFTGEFSLNLNSKFINITINPNNPFKGQSFSLSSILSTEFGVQLVNKNVSCQYYDINSWVTLSSDLTDSNGFTTFLVNTFIIDFEGDLLLRLVWAGDNITGNSKNVTVHVIHYINNITLSIRQNDVLVYRNRNTTFSVVINNIGNSNLKITNISIELNHELSYSIVEINYQLINWLTPDRYTNFIFEVAVTNINKLEISVSITAQNMLTNETITSSKEISLNVFDSPIIDYFIENFIFFIGIAFALVWIITIIYARRTKKRLETPIEEVKKKPRRVRERRYVPVAELKKPTPAKKIVKPKEELKEIEEKKKMDLDSLLEERGLADKKKKPKE
ncbi:MAG: hypothetical protein JSV23_01070 [Promethearchaeota archaeon]|nr:MAG: hypothetical protein JSV23_01070 [Candidatus Lokiarchaeota archaeon]